MHSGSNGKPCASSGVSVKACGRTGVSVCVCLRAESAQSRPGVSNPRAVSELVDTEPGAVGGFRQENRLPQPDEAHGLGTDFGIMQMNVILD